ncbi:hypothetical protein [Bradyrhizobium canariense]|uniref:Patatin-like phospholipase n=1 Tax=Bradyrhizobium canariense TaxID=255045 RepID=A0A1X3G6D6_9BRAD|nr:hypothetical protein [Bradyrhizobium canariense]OSI78631.1 hypothetical protein BSZ22_02660 [Bradyrhizobium canariense]OSI82216.1 hypothetical protein BSZ23_02665 [Bradyrhizobium canariense]OSI96341.1 hypothetical protein BSZ25_02295 [Bradyrhizobium canariense]OSI96944.1 hypothetical protein BSZ24_02695 [Bradyrhizobium canariense]OSJ14962.1 hypothetical protein BSZ16_02365 [Bradyrhizobium canariense]
MVDAAIRLLSLANQLASTTRRVCLNFEEGEAGTMGFLNRMGFFDHLSDQVEVIPAWPDYSAAQIHRGGNKALVEIARANKDERDNDLPTRLTNALMVSCRDREDSSALEGAAWTIFAELIDNIFAHSDTQLDGYPLFLPALDETFAFNKDGAISQARVILTDGGIYDNLGLGCLWPDRSRDVSLNVVSVDTIICCSAGYGLRQEPPSQFLPARMLSVFSTLFDRAQNASIHRLHDAQRFGLIKNFIFPYLGQLDRQLPNPPPDLVRREETHSYPTNFNAMPVDWIDRLSRRGEQLTICLARAYLPHLLNHPSKLNRAQTA